MSSPIIVDTGPLVALIDRRDAHYHWSERQFATLDPPLLTCEAVVTEASHLACHLPQGRASIVEFLTRGLLRIDFDLEVEARTINDLLVKYQDVPMSLADACLVRMAELHAGFSILTLDSDFSVYRIHRREIIPIILPTGS